MSVIKVECIDQVLTFQNMPDITAGDVNVVEVEFTFSNHWDGFGKTAVFYVTEDEVFNVVVGVDNKVVVPHEVLRYEGYFYLGVYGVKDDKVLTSSVLRYTILKGALTHRDINLGEPTPDVYEQFLQKLEENNLSIKELNAQLSRVLAKNLRMVSKADSEYSTIMSAVEAGGDTTDNPITIMVAPGTYEEQVYIRQWSRINLVGTNKKDCIVVNHGGGYTDEPLITAGERYIANMTFRATHEKSTVADKNQWKSYAFHGDKSSGGDGTTLVENCRFESYHSASVGLGVYNNQTFHFKNCEFYSKIEWDSAQANLGAFFAHNNVAGGVTNGKLIFENCTFFMDNDRAGYGHACYINDANLTNGDGSGNPINVQFINCTLLRNVGGFVNALRVDTVTSIDKLSGSINLMYSNGNNISSINTPQIIWNEVQLPNGVTNVGSNFTPLRYCKNNIGEVVVEGTVRGASSSQETKLFTLPVGFRPKYHRFYDVNDTEGSKIGKILVNRNGDVSINGDLSSSRIDISFTFLAEQ